MNSRDNKIQQIKATCEKLVQDLNTRSDFFYSPRMIDIGNYRVAMISFNNTFNKILSNTDHNDYDYDKLLLAAESFIESTCKIPTSDDDVKFKEFSDEFVNKFEIEVKNLKNVCEEEKKREEKEKLQHYYLHQQFLKKYQIIDEILSNKLKMANSIYQKIELLNLIKQYQKEIQSDYETYRLKVSFLRNDIEKKCENYESYFKVLQSKTLDQLKGEILQNIIEVQEIDKKFTRPVIRLEEEPINENDGIEMSAESKKLTENIDIIRQQEQNLKKLQSNVKEISSIIKTNQDVLSEQSKNNIKELLGFKKDIEVLIENTKRNISVIRNIHDAHRYLQDKANKELRLIQKEIEKYKIGMKEIQTYYLKFKQNIAGINDSESELVTKINSESKIKHRNNVYHKHLENLLEQLKKLGKLEDVKYSYGNSLEFSNRFKTKFDSIKECVNQMIETCVSYKLIAEKRINKSQQNITAIEYAMSNYNIRPDNFEKINGKKFKNIKAWIKQNSKNYKNLIAHRKHTTPEKQERIDDLISGIDKSTDLKQLMTILSHTYRRRKYPPNTRLFFQNNKNQKISISEMDQALRKTTSFFGFYKITGYNSTTDKYLTQLEKEILEYLKNTYKVDLTSSRKSTSNTSKNNLGVFNGSGLTC